MNYEQNPKQREKQQYSALLLLFPYGSYFKKWQIRQQICFFLYWLFLQLFISTLALTLSVLSMQKREAVLTEQQVAALKGQLWWVADRDRPFLMKFALSDDCVLLELTDLKSLWVGRFSLNSLLQDKQRYARSLQLKQGRDLLLLFESLLSSSDPQVTYVFTEIKEAINFTFRKRITIFDFSWTLRLVRVGCSPVELICKELISPMAAALQAQAKRVELLRCRFELVEKDFMRKMSEMERTLYKSPLVQDLEDWRLLLSKQEDHLLSFFPLDDACKFFQKTHLGDGFRKEKEKEKEKPIDVFEDQRKNRVIAKAMNSQVFEIAQHQLNKQLERQRQKMKREKKVDFL